MLLLFFVGLMLSHNSNMFWNCFLPIYNIFGWVKMCCCFMTEPVSDTSRFWSAERVVRGAPGVSIAVVVVVFVPFVFVPFVIVAVVVLVQSRRGVRWAGIGGIGEVPCFV